MKIYPKHKGTSWRTHVCHLWHVWGTSAFTNTIRSYKQTKTYPKGNYGNKSQKTKIWCPMNIIKKILVGEMYSSSYYVTSGILEEWITRFLRTVSTERSLLRAEFFPWTVWHPYRTVNTLWQTWGWKVPGFSWANFGWVSLLRSR